MLQMCCRCVACCVSLLAARSRDRSTRSKAANASTAQPDLYVRDAELSSAGYKFLASRMKKEKDPDADKDPDAGKSAEQAFMHQLDELESQLNRHAGPYLVGSVSSTLARMPRLASRYAARSSVQSIFVFSNAHSKRSPSQPNRG